jgi:hypothetical protein
MVEAPRFLSVARSDARTVPRCGGLPRRGGEAARAQGFSRALGAQEKLFAAALRRQLHRAFS